MGRLLLGRVESGADDTVHDGGETVRAESGCVLGHALDQEALAFGVPSGEVADRLEPLHLGGDQGTAFEEIGEFGVQHVDPTA